MQRRKNTRFDDRRRHVINQPTNQRELFTSSLSRRCVHVVFSTIVIKFSVQRKKRSFKYKNIIKKEEERLFQRGEKREKRKNK